MKTEVIYTCEICGKKSTDKHTIEACESQGVFDGTKYPKGLMMPYYHNDFVGIFALPKQARPANSFNSGNHIGETNYWACRTEKFRGDSLGKEVCGHDFLDSDEESVNKWLQYRSMKPEHLECPEFKRMVKYLKSQDIIPKYYYEGKLCIVK